jgi:NHLM bacteriocin system ABC transporter ATP-binding protein
MEPGDSMTIAPPPGDELDQATPGDASTGTIERAHSDAALITRYQDHGTSTSAGGNQPLLLDDPSRVWLVTGAGLQLFVVPVRDGAVDGPRSSLRGVPPGSVLFGHAPVEIEETTWALMGVGLPETRVVSLPRETLDDPALAPAAQWSASRWLMVAERSIRPGPGPQAATTLRAGEDLTLGAGESAMTYDSPVWLEVREGSVQLYGLEGRSFDASTGPVPLTASAWIVAPDAATVAVYGEAPEDGALRVVPIVTDMVVRARVAAAAIERRRNQERLLQEVASDNLATDRAIRGILGVFDPKQPQMVLAPSDSSDPLLAACKLVGHAGGVQIATPPAQEGVVADPLRAIARASRMRTRQVMLDGQWWKEDGGPLLGYLADGEIPVALLPRERGGYNVVDGLTGHQTQVDAAVSRTLQPFAQMFYRPFPDKVMDAVALFKFGFRGTTRDLWAIVVLGMLGGLLGIATPIATGLLIDDIIPEADRGQLLQLSLALMASAIAVAAFTITRNIALMRVEGRTDAAVQSAVWDRLLGLPVPFFRDYTAGDLATRALGIDRIRKALSDVTTTALLAFIFSAPSFALQVFISLPLAMVSLGMLVLMLGLTWIATRRQLVIQHGMLEVGGYLSGLVLQLLNGIPKLRIAGAERRAFSVWAHSYGTQSTLSRENQAIQIQLSVLFAVFPPIATLVLFGFYVEYQWATVSTGSFLSFNAAFGQIVGAAIGMATAIGAMTSIVPTFERAKPILAALPETDEAKADPGVLRGEIEMSGVSFAYNEGDPPTIEDISFRIRQGEFVAFVGPSGAGKSTLLRLLIGFDSPDSGSVLFDGQNLETIDVQAVRRQMGVVLQNGTVMPGELGQNIIGTTNLTLDDAWEAARMAGLDGDIKDMPMGMHTYVMEGGTTLSGGQRQRLMIARAIVTRPRILVFDEATSALDNRTQEIVRESLEQLNSTRIVIAHRLSTIAKADKIYVLVAGRIVQSGTYDELMQHDGPFMQMARRQLV